MESGFSPENQAREEWEQSTDDLDAARFNFEHGRYDTAVNRAYYAAFHAAKACLVLEGHLPRSHTGTQTQFSKYLVRANKVDPKMGQILHGLFENRVESDYNPSVDFTKKRTKELVDDATQFVKSMENVLEKEMNDKGDDQAD